MALLLLLFPFLELYVLVMVGGRIGVINTLFALVSVGVLGAGLARTQGRYIVGKMQASLTRGEVPADSVLHGLLVLIGGVLFLIPGFITDLVAILFVIPGPRHLFVAFLKRRMASQMKSGSFRVYGFGDFHPGRRQQQPPRDEWMREVSPKVIDIKPVRPESED